MSETGGLVGLLGNVVYNHVARQLNENGNSDDPALYFAEEPGPPEEPCPHCGRMLPHSRVETDDGEFLFYNPFPDPCPNPECMRIVQAEEEAWERERAEEAAREHEELVLNALRLSGVPGSYAHESFETYKIAGSPILASARDQVQEYVANFAQYRKTGTGLYIAGNVGTGKTHLAAAAVRYLAERGVCSAMFRSSMDLLDELKESYDSGFGGPSETDIIGQCKRAGLLVIDDLGKEYGTQWAMTKLSDIIHARYAEGLPIIVTSNYSLQDIGRVLAQNGAKSSADAIVSRLAGRSKTVTVIGDDYRMAGHAAG